MGRGKGPLYAPIQGRGNIQCLRLQGPLPPTAKERDGLWLLRCCVEGCGWSMVAKRKESGVQHRRYSHHAHLQTHLFEPAPPPDEVARRKRERDRQNSSNYRLRQKRLREVSPPRIEHTRSPRAGDAAQTYELILSF